MRQLTGESLARRRFSLTAASNYGNGFCMHSESTCGRVVTVARGAGEDQWKAERKVSINVHPAAC